MDDNASELYRKYRPKLFRDVIGQPEAIRQLKEMTDNNRVPHVLMLHGPSGTGKTTLGRILKEKLKCSNRDYQEVNCASVESPIDAIRDIERTMNMSPWDGPCRIWLLDECQSWSKSGFAQQATLKIFEDTPKHVYFFLCTTDPDKLLPAIKTRCTKIELKPLCAADMLTVLKGICEKGKLKVPQSVLDRIVEFAKGSPREAVVLLNSVSGLKTEEEQLNAVCPGKVKEDAFNIVRALLWKKSTWDDVRKVIAALGDGQDWEGLRYLVLANAAKEMLKDGGNHARAALINEAFEKNWFDSKMNGLLRACWEVMGNG